MGAEVKAPVFNGVPVDHPSIVSSIKNLAKQGKSKEEAQKIVGMPREIIDRYFKEVGR